MTDLFPEKCPCCGQDIVQQSTSFDAFWADVPHKVGKADAAKAWGKMNAQSRRAAHDGVKTFYAWFAKAYPSASAIHPVRYLTGRRWEDEAAQPQVPQAHRLAMHARHIATGKTYLCTQISATIARECIAAGLVTEAQCRAVRVL